jgi:transketolase
MVHECLAVADELAKSGRKATVIDAYSLPLKTEDVLRIAARSGGTIVTVEDNYTGGLDAELAIAIANNGDEITLRNLYVQRLPKSGKEPEDVLQFVGLDRKRILEAVS